MFPPSEDRDAKIKAVVTRLYEVSDRQAEKFIAEFERLKATGSEDLFDSRWGFIDGRGEIDLERGAVKYALNVRGHVAQKLRYLPYFDGISSALDIGVGPAQLFLLLQDALGIRMHGIDRAKSQGEFLYRAIWDDLGITDKIAIMEVKAGSDIPIPPNTDAVLAFWSNFDNGWGPAEHGWFVDHCRAKDAKHIYWRFNSHVDYAVIPAFYAKLGAQFPRERDPGFCVLAL